MKLSNSIEENSIAWIDGKAAYSRLLSTKHCKCISQAHRKLYKGYNGVASKYINRYAALFIQAREYTGCDTQEILLSIKRRVYQITDFFRIVDTKKDDLFIYSIS